MRFKLPAVTFNQKMNEEYSMLRDGEIVVDNFAGGGGASTGIELGLNCCVDIAVNHDDHAIDMHRVNK